MIAIVPVRAGDLPLGGDEAVAEAFGRAVVIGDGATLAADALGSIGDHLFVCEQDTYRPAAWAAGLAQLDVITDAENDVVILPASPDGRDLAPHVARLLDRPLVSGAVAIAPGRATVARQGGLVMEELTIEGPYVATLQPGVRGVEIDLTVDAEIELLELPTTSAAASDPTLVELTPPDPATMDLSEAPRIVGGGAGLGSADNTALLALVATALSCSIGGTRVITDWGWLPFERQIGTTGVAVDPELYLAFGISGAVQHVAGLGSPHHIISVNTDASCPMMALADVAIVADAPAVVKELAERLQVEHDG